MLNAAAILSSAIQSDYLKHAMFCSSVFSEGSNSSIITLSLALWVDETLHGKRQYREIQENVIWYTQITIFEVWIREPANKQSMCPNDEL